MAYDPDLDKYKYTQNDPSVQARKAAAVTPSNTVDLDPYAKALYIGTAGDITVIPVGQEDEVTFANHPVGYFIGVQIRRVMSTGTSASDIVALFD